MSPGKDAWVIAHITALLKKQGVAQIDEIIMHLQQQLQTEGISL